MEEQDSLSRLFVGEKYPYYAESWKKKSSWNWSAFFAGLGWMLYRKMYFYSFIYAVVVLAEIVFELFVPIPEFVSRIIGIAIQVVVASQGNHWYKLHVQKKLQEISPSGESNEAVREQVLKQGGTNLGIALGICGLIIALIVVSMFVQLLASGQLSR